MPNSAAAAPWFSCAHLTADERRLLTSYAALSDSGRRAVDAVLETLPKEHRDTPRLRIAPLAALALKSVQSVAIVVSLLG
jgi:hypothetical protein